MVTLLYRHLLIMPGHFGKKSAVSRLSQAKDGTLSQTRTVEALVTVITGSHFLSLSRDISRPVAVQRYSQIVKVLKIHGIPRIV